MDVSMVYANAVKMIFFGWKDFMSNGMKQLKRFIVKKPLISLYILDSYSKGKVRIKKISMKKLAFY